MSAAPMGTRDEQFGEYELVRYLAAGGMADLYLARSPRHDDLVVIKRIQQRYMDHTRVVKMFIDEGRIAKLLEHPNVVRVLDVGTRMGTNYIAMEYIPGHDLIALARRAVETGRWMPRPIAVAIAAQVAGGLAYAHARTDESGEPLRIVHCDISPGNIVVSLRGTAKIVDFGIARATIALREEDGVAGKYNYMAPEQVRGEPIDARADLFSLGVILWELTVGKRLFKGAPQVVMRKVCEDPIPRPRDVREGYPEDLERIVMRLLSRDPAARYPDAASVRADLRGYLAGRSGWHKRDVAVYLRDLWRAPRRAVADEDDLRDIEEEELELNRAMPEVDVDVEHDADEEDAADVEAPPPVPVPPLPLAVAVSRAAGDASESADTVDAFADLPPEGAAAPVTTRREAASVPRRPPNQSGEPPRYARKEGPAAELPEPGVRQRPRRRRRRVSRSLVIGISMLITAAALLIAWFAVGP